jgi:hypothetical protein
VARLEWRSTPRPASGWFLVPESGEPERLDVDLSIDELARDQHSGADEWELNAELSAILSTALALDAAERLLHRRPARPGGRFRRLRSADRFEIYVTEVEAAVLLRAVPELPLESVSDVTVLAGELLPEAFETVARRIALLGGRIVAVFRDRGDAEPE